MAHATQRSRGPRWASVLHTGRRERADCVPSPTSKPFTAASIGGAIATRAIIADLRSGLGPKSEGGIGGPAPFAKTDRSRFLQALDEALVRLGRGR